VFDMLRVYVPEEYQLYERLMRPIFTFGLEVSGDPDKYGDKVVWAVADGTAEDLADRVVDYRKYDWTQAATVCFGHDEESLVHSGKIKDHHDLVTIPQTSLSINMDQAMAIILAHYVTVVPDEEREAKVQKAMDGLRALRAENRKKWLDLSLTGQV